MTVLYTPTATNETNSQEFDDGDAPQATNINPLGEAAFNTAKWAANRVGNYRLIQIVEYSFDDDAAPYQFEAFTTAAFASPAAGGVCTMVGALVGDIMVCRACGVAELDDTTTEWGEVRLLANDNGGVSIVAVPSARTMLQLPVNTYYPFAIEGKHVVGSSGTTTITLQGKMSAVTVSQNLKIQSVLSMVVEHYRSNA